MRDHLHRFEALEQMRVLILQEIDAGSTDQRNRRPAPGTWSALQVLDHVISSEEMTLSYIRKKTQNPSAVTGAGLGSAIRSLLLKIALRSRLKFKAPPRAATFPETQDLELLRSRWTAAREQWRAFIESCPEDLARMAIFRHPIAGRINLEQTLAFMQDHLGHHHRQIESRLGI